MELIPDERSDETEDVAAEEGDGDQGPGRLRIKGLYRVNRLDHVGPEKEI